MEIIFWGVIVNVTKDLLINFFFYVTFILLSTLLFFNLNITFFILIKSYC